VIARRWTVNGAVREVATGPLRPLLEVLREELELIGAKKGCGEGECGACTVLLDGRPAPACLVPAGQVRDGCEILTVEGIAATSLGGAIVAAFVERGAVQCGICTPGMVVAAYALLRETPRPDDERIRRAIGGHLCRCTGYAAIVEAIRVAGERAPAAAPSAARVSPAGAASRDDAGFLSPATLAEALALRGAHPGVAILAGGTDLMVAWNGAPDARPARVLSVDGVGELRGVREDRGAIWIGAATRVADLATDPRLARAAPALALAAAHLGTRAVRERATIGGNLVNASPAADLVPPLFVAGASLRLAAASGTREIPIFDFYRGYKDCDLRPDEILAAIRVPALPAGARETGRKLGTRRGQSCAKISVTVRLRAEEGRIGEIAIAAGSAAPTVMRLPRAETALRGAPLEAETAGRAGRLAEAEVAPITDIRSTAEYRRAMTGVLVADLLRELMEG
jgi:xanthine dehydrogenase small subunit